MVDFTGNPYLNDPRFQLSDDQRRQYQLGSLGSALTSFGAGIAQSGASGQPWFAGIAPGAAMASNAMAQQRQYDETEQMRRFQLGLQASEYQDKHDERQRLMKAREAYANGGGPGINYTPSPVQMGPSTAISKIEGDYSSIGPVADAKGSRGYGKYQVMDYNVPQWTQEALGQAMTPQQFLQNPQAQDAVFNHKFGQYRQKYGDVGAAKAWFAGEGGMNDPNRADVNGMTVAKYGNQFVANGGAAGGPPMPQSSLGLPPGAMVDTGPPSAAPPVPNAMPGPVQIRPPDQVPSMTPAIAQGGSDSSPTPVQYQPNPQTPAPQMVAPPEPPVVPMPAVPPQIDQQLRQAVGAGLMTVEQAETKKAEIVRELHSHAQTQATQKFQRDLEVWKVNRGEAAKDVWRPLTPQERDQMLPGSRPDAQLQINSRTGEVKPILSARDTKPDVSQYYQDPEVQKKVAAMSPTDRAAFNAATGSGDHKGASAILTKAQTGLTEEQQALSGDDLLKTLPFGDREIVEGLTTGRLTPTDLSKRAGNGTDFNRLIALASKVDSSYSPGPGGARRAFETKYMSGAGQGQATLLAANTAIQHMQIAHDLVGQLHNGDSQISNTVKNYLKTQFGAGDVTSAHAALQLMGVEIAKTVKGAGSLGLAEEQAAQKLATTSMSDDQINKNIHVLTDFMMGRVHSVEDLAKSHGISDKTVENYISPRSREALKYIDDNPVGGVKSGAPGQTIKIDMSGKRQ